MRQIDLLMRSGFHDEFYFFRLFTENFTLLDSFKRSVDKMGELFFSIQIHLNNYLIKKSPIYLSEGKHKE